MNDYEILRYLHKIGSPMSGVVVDYLSHRRLLIQTNSTYPAILRYDELVDDPSTLSDFHIPVIGQTVNAVVDNFAEGTIYLTAKPSRISAEQIDAWKAFYDYLDTLEVGAAVRGRVVRSEPFGLFVDIGGPCLGLIDIGHTSFNHGDELSIDRSDWPKVGEEILCRISYFRFSFQQIGLGWLKQGA